MGYITPGHSAMVREHGPCDQHRLSFDALAYAYAAQPDERRAARHYRLRGYRILGQNVWAGGYELDLIVRRGRRLVFCEVKEKSGDGYGDPLEMVDGRSCGGCTGQPRPGSPAIPRAAGLDYRFEVVAVRPGQLQRVAV